VRLLARALHALDCLVRGAPRQVGLAGIVTQPFDRAIKVVKCLLPSRPVGLSDEPGRSCACTTGSTATLSRSSSANDDASRSNSTPCDSMSPRVMTRPLPSPATVSLSTAR
jgi:hypothetical protein